METDIEFLMKGLERAVIQPPGAGTDSMIFSGLTLICHLRSEHPDLCSYNCVQCGSTFNTMKDLSSHISLMHRDPQVKCQVFTYLTTSPARMRCHVRVHTKGERFPARKPFRDIQSYINVDWRLSVNFVMRLSLILPPLDTCSWETEMDMFARIVKDDLTLLHRESGTVSSAENDHVYDLYCPR